VWDEEPIQAANQRWYGSSTDHPNDVRSSDTAAANDNSTTDYDHHSAAASHSEAVALKEAQGLTWGTGSRPEPRDTSPTPSTFNTWNTLQKRAIIVCRSAEASLTLSAYRACRLCSSSRSSPKSFVYGE
jgi:hypothetical protein